MGQELSEIKRVIENLVTFGVVSEVDYDKARFRAQISNRLTAWLPFPIDFGRNFKRWRPIRVGTQALFCCPSGDPANAMLVQMLYSTELPPPSFAPEIDLIKFDDGAVFSYNVATSSLKIDVPSAGKITLSVGSTTLDLTSAQTTLSTPKFKGVET